MAIDTCPKHSGCYQLKWVLTHFEKLPFSPQAKASVAIDIRPKHSRCYQLKWVLTYFEKLPFSPQAKASVAIDTARSIPDVIN